MSNRDPLYGRTSGTDFTSPSTGSNAGESGDQASGKADQAKAKADQAKAKGQQVADQARQKGQQAKQKASEATDKAHAQADKGMDQAASGMDQAADKLRQRGQKQGGSVASATAMTADKLESASSYLRDKDTDQIVDDLEALIRSKPTESLLVAAGVGFVLSKLFR